MALMLAAGIFLRRVGAEKTGTASGIVQVGFTVGLFVNAVMFGALADMTGSYTSGWVAVAAAFAIA
ncbi:MAG: hypothetical protein GEU78_13400 [Actinobacteria bacterium]|nr:hypothetical protein [Actinomycetota bacterium]